MCLSEINSALNIFDKSKNGIRWLLENKKKFSKMPHYFKNYHKHVTVYKNGNGIIINSFDIVFNDYTTLFLERGINIGDGKKEANFSNLESMKKTPLKDRFDRCGFWVYSDNNIIESSEEKYWTGDKSGSEDKRAKDDPKELRWIFNFNRSKIKLNTPYHIVYILSIQGMFPINNGVIDMESINDPNSIDSSSSSIEIENAVENLTYTVSFENSIDLETEPSCTLTELTKVSKNTHPLIEKEYNIIYSKYICCMKKPQLGSKIKIKWRFKGGSKDED